MPQNLLEQLSAMTVVVSDTGDINAVRKFKPRDATTNPSLIGAAAQMKEYAQVVDDALGWARKDAGAERARRTPSCARAIDRLERRVRPPHPRHRPGPRLDRGRRAPLVRHARPRSTRPTLLIKQYEAAGRRRERILIKIASTWEGIKAAEQLEKEGIHCNLTLLFGIHQAVACAEAKVTLISPFVGRILDWYKKSTGKAGYEAAEDPGVLSVTRIYEYFKHFGHKTEIMGASFRNLGEITELAGCDLLTIAPNFLEELHEDDGRRCRASSTRRRPRRAKIERIAMDEATFRKMHAADKMASDKLEEGIAGLHEGDRRAREAARRAARRARVAREGRRQERGRAEALPGLRHGRRRLHHARRVGRRRRGLRRARPRPRRAHHPGGARAGSGRRFYPRLDAL